MSEAYTIRPLEKDDLPTVLSWRNHPEIRQFMFNQHEIKLEEHTQWFKRTSQDSSKRLFVVENSSGPFGFVQFSNVGIGATSDWGFYVAPNAPKGSGTQLGTLALDFAFNKIRLHKVCGQAIEQNLASIAFHKKLGFRQEGLLLEHQKIGDTYHSIVCFGLLAKEWPINRSEN